MAKITIIIIQDGQYICTNEMSHTLDYKLVPAVLE